MSCWRLFSYQHQHLSCLGTGCPFIATASLFHLYYHLQTLCLLPLNMMPLSILYVYLLCMLPLKYDAIIYTYTCCVCFLLSMMPLSVLYVYLFVVFLSISSLCVSLCAPLSSFLVALSFINLLYALLSTHSVYIILSNIFYVWFHLYSDFSYTFLPSFLCI